MRPNRVMAVLVTAIHAATLRHRSKLTRSGTAWMAVTSTAMTGVGENGTS